MVDHAHGGNATGSIFVVTQWPGHSVRHRRRRDPEQVSPETPATSATNPASTKQVCADENGGLTLPPWFCATVFADRIGHARHLVVAPSSVVERAGRAVNGAALTNGSPFPPIDILRVP